MEDIFGKKESEEISPVNPIIMAKITDLETFKLATGYAFSDDEEAMEWVKNKKIKISEEVLDL